MGKPMIRVIIILVSFILVSCAHPVLVREKDKVITNQMLGSWFYSISSDVCPESGWISFKRSGKYSRSSENCQIADDSFGNHYYGWYVANEHICFVDTKDHLIHAKVFGFTTDHCKWKIVEYSEKEVVVHKYWYLDEGESPRVISFKRDENP